MLPPAMLKAARMHAWASVDFEELVLLVKEALEPISFSQRISPNEAWTSVVRADDILTYGGRLIAAAGGGAISDPNSFGTMHREWREFLGKANVLGGSVRTDHMHGQCPRLCAGLPPAGRCARAASHGGFRSAWRPRGIIRAGRSSPVRRP